VKRLAGYARLGLLMRRASGGLFFGLLPGVIVAALAGTVPLPLPALAIAGCAAAAGTLAGAVSALFRRMDVRHLLIRADRSLGSKELASTALELAEKPWGGTFSEAVIEDAAALLAGSTPQRILGRPRLPLLPYVPVLAVIIALALIFPLDLRAFFAARQSRQGELAMIGEDLQSYGERLRDAARSQNLGRSLALSEELAKLGRDLAEGSIQKDEALERMSDLERRLVAEYELRLRAVPPPGRIRGGSGPGGANDGTGERRPGAGGEGTANGSAEASPGDADSGQELKDLGDALKRLRQGMQRAATPDNGGDQGQPPSFAQNPKTEEPGNGFLPPSAGSSEKGSANPLQDEGGGSGSGAGPDSKDSRGAAGGAPGVTPAPDVKGPPSQIPQGGAKFPLRAPAAPGNGDSTKFLVRALPDWTGSRLPEDKILRQYEQQAESALAREEIPPKLKEYVKGYFTDIGMSPGETRQ
jgi:hypothetical protein